MKPLQLTMRAFGAYAGEQIIDFTLLGDKNFFPDPRTDRFR